MGRLDCFWAETNSYHSPARIGADADACSRRNDAGGSGLCTAAADSTSAPDCSDA